MRHNAPFIESESKSDPGRRGPAGLPGRTRGAAIPAWASVLRPNERLGDRRISWREPVTAIDPGLAPAEDAVTPAIAFCLELGRAMHTYGVPAHQLEGELAAISRRVGTPADFFTTPTLILAAFGEGATQQTYLVRTEPGLVDLGKLSRIHQIVGGIDSGAIAPRTAREQLRAVVDAPERYPAWLSTLCFGVSGAAVARFLGGGIAEIVTAAVIGLLIGALALVAETRPKIGRLFTLLASLFASLVAVTVSGALAPHAVVISTLAGLIVLIPGLTLTIAINELATRNLVSGTSRLMNALVDFVMIGFGTALGMRLGAALGVPLDVAPVSLPEWTAFVALGVAPLALAVLFRAPLGLIPWVIIAGVLGFEAAAIGGPLVGPQLGALLGAFAVGTAAHCFERTLRRPATIMLVPGLMLLVPGSIGFRSISALINDDVVGGTSTLVTMILTATAIVVGLLLASVVSEAPRRG